MLLCYHLPLPITAGWSILVCAKEKMLWWGATEKDWLLETGFQKCCLVVAPVVIVSLKPLIQHE